MACIKTKGIGGSSDYCLEHSMRDGAKVHKKDDVFISWFIRKYVKTYKANL